MTTPAPPIEPFTISTPDGADIRGHRYGLTQDRARTVVLSHCWMGHTATWQPVIDRLARTHHVVAFDHRGHGRSSTGADAPTIERLADDLELVVDELGLDPAAMAGHSLGGMALIELASRPDNPVRGLVLVSTSAYGGRPPLLQLASKALTRSMSSPIGERFVQNRLGRAIARGALGRHATPEAVDATIDPVRTTAPQVRRHQFDEVVEFDRRDRLGSITAPSRILVGGWDTLTPVSHSKALHASIPSSTLTVIPKVGHMLPLERPGVVAAAIEATAAQSAPPDPVGAESSQKART